MRDEDLRLRVLLLSPASEARAPGNPASVACGRSNISLASDSGSVTVEVVSSILPFRTAQQAALMRSRTADPSGGRRGAPLPTGRQRAGEQRSHHAAAQVPWKYTYHGQRCRAERRARPGCLQPGGTPMHGDRWGAREPARGGGGGGSR